MNDLKKLKPCPYCGNTGPTLYKGFNGMFFVHCGRYLCDTKFKKCYSTKEECIKKWNENADLINGGQCMNIGKAIGIFKNIDNAAATDAEKIEAINEVVAMETHNGITKADTMRALKFAMGCLMVSDINVHMLERRLKHLLQSDFIRSFDEVNLFTKEYKRDITEADAKIFYLCDGKKCGENHNCGECKHTWNIKHAKNFKYDGHYGYWENDAVMDPETVKDKCPFEHKPDCTYYPDGCGKCTYINP